MQLIWTLAGPNGAPLRTNYLGLRSSLPFVELFHVV